MKVQVTKAGALIPKRLLKGAKQVEIRKEPGRIVVFPVPAPDDPLFELGSNPGRSGLRDLAEQHDKYLYGADA